MLFINLNILAKQLVSKQIRNFPDGLLSSCNMLSSWSVQNYLYTCVFYKPIAFIGSMDHLRAWMDLDCNYDGLIQEGQSGAK